VILESINEFKKKARGETSNMTDSSQPTPWRRLMAMIYELLPAAAILLVAAAIPTPLMADNHVAAGSLWFQFYLLSVLYLYFVWCWTHGGQTLGMRPWGLKIIGNNHRILDWPTASLRFGVALLGWIPLGLGHWWMLFDRHGRNWHDLVCDTRVCRWASNTPTQDQEGEAEHDNTGS